MAWYKMLKSNGGIQPSEEYITLKDWFIKFYNVYVFGLSADSDSIIFRYQRNTTNSTQTFGRAWSYNSSTDGAGARWIVGRTASDGALYWLETGSGQVKIQDSDTYTPIYLNWTGSRGDYSRGTNPPYATGAQLLSMTTTSATLVYPQEAENIHPYYKKYEDINSLYTFSQIANLLEIKDFYKVVNNISALYDKILVCQTNSELNFYFYDEGNVPIIDNTDIVLGTPDYIATINNSSIQTNILTSNISTNSTDLGSIAISACVRNSFDIMDAEDVVQLAANRTLAQLNEEIGIEE